MVVFWRCSFFLPWWARGRLLTAGARAREGLVGAGAAGDVVFEFAAGGPDGSGAFPEASEFGEEFLFDCAFFDLLFEGGDFGEEFGLCFVQVALDVVELSAKVFEFLEEFVLVCHDFI